MGWMTCSRVLCLLLRYIVIGDGLEEEVCAEHMEWPFVRVTLTPQPPVPQQQQQQPLEKQAAVPTQLTSRQRVVANGLDVKQPGEAAAKKAKLTTASSSGDHHSSDSAEDADTGGDTAADNGNDSKAGGQAQQDKAAGDQLPGAGGIANGTAAVSGVSPSANVDAEGPAGDKSLNQALQAQQQPRQQGEYHVAEASKRLSGALVGGQRCRVRVDALGSAGHTLLELTADKLRRLALSIK